MRKLYVAATEASRSAFECEREVIDFDNANFTQVSIAVMTADEALAGKLEQIESNAFGIPVVILNEACKSSKDHSKPRNEVDTSLKSPV